MGKSRLVLAFGFLAAAAASAGAAPQSPSPKTGAQVVVTQAASGEELSGRLLELSSTTLAMLVDGHRVEIPIDSVLRIDVRNDSLKNGAIIGAAVMGGLTGLACAEMSDTTACLTGLVVNTGVGAAAGAAIDALHKGRTPIYIKAGKSDASFQVRLRF